MALAWLSGPSCLQRLKATCRVASSSAAEALPVLRAECPAYLYVCGGYSEAHPLSSVERFHPSTCQWETLPSMEGERAGPAATSLNGDLFVFGAADVDKVKDQALSAECFRPSSGRWESLPPLLECRERPAAASLGGWLYVCGGIEDATQPFTLLSSVERISAWDDTIGSWEAAPPMLEARDSPAAAAVGGHLYVCGGDNIGFQPLQTVERYDPKLHRWEALPSMAERRSGAAAAACGGCIYVCGGSDGTQQLSSAERFDPETGVWERLPSMSQRRFGAAVAAVSGKIYACGGNSDGVQLSSAECFDPKAGKWEDITPMSVPRVRAAAVAVSQ
eukprot:TRINITY_DN30167_c0_g1_i1.p1 TRINITY_DN30167_c0_g1~~TRINITY_DN30167_c0_g1_i1.p1  ORF type:complete len:389 (-),score=83.77 TRINITY_DN30167_c0_g1_i1:218-1216(-)